MSDSEPVLFNVTVLAADFRGSRDFYRDVIGLRCGWGGTGPHHVRCAGDETFTSAFMKKRATDPAFN